MSILHPIWWISWGLSVLTVPSVLVQKSGKPTAALIWILALFILPPVVLPSWWFIGRTYLKVRRKRRRHAGSNFEQRLLERREQTSTPAQATKALLDIVSLPADLRQRGATAGWRQPRV